MPRRFIAAAVIVLSLGGGAVCVAAHTNAPTAEPEQRILVAPLGYRAPGIRYLLSGRAFSTLYFIDGNHLLFTFHESRLLRREPVSARSHNDQIIKALTLKLPAGTVEASTEWRMHDRSKYLWPVADGRFLVRQGDSYGLTDAELKLRPYINVSTPVLATEVSPDGHTLVIEHELEKHTPAEEARLMAEADKFGDPPPAEDTQITLMDIPSRHELGALRTESPINVPITSDGYVGVERDKNEDQFLVRFVPFSGKTVLLGKVASTCTPRENFVTQKALVIESCGPKSSDSYLDAWTTDGKKLWSSQRDGHLVWPTFAFSATGTRYAVGLLHVAHTINLADSLNDEDVREQVVQVFDAATGALLMTTTASPVLTAGQNFALSANGDRLAVLREGAIEIYKVPSAAATAPVKR
jgi:hypothetical protein